MAGTAGYAGWLQAIEGGKPFRLEFSGIPVLAVTAAREDRDGDGGSDFSIRLGEQQSLPSR
jgi:hypothetical protein